MSRRQNKFAQKRYNIASEEVNVYGSTLANFKYNDYQILTVASFAPTNAAISHMLLTGQATTTAYAALILPATFVSPVSNGSTIVGNTLHVTKKGTYIFRVELDLDAAATVNVRFNVNGTEDGNAQASVLAAPGGQAITSSFCFLLGIAADGDNSITFDVAGVSNPTGSAQPAILGTSRLDFSFNSGMTLTG